MRPVRVLLLLLVPCFAARAAGQDLEVVAELPLHDPGAANSVVVRRLAPAGPLFALSFSVRDVSVWRAGGSGEPVVTPLVGSGPYVTSPVLVDFDGDGLTDLAYVGTNEIRVWRGDGSGRFAPTALIPTSAQQYELVAGDFDGDGRPDLASLQSAGVPGAVVSVFLSTGGFGFEAPRQTLLAWGTGVGSLAAGDLDGDGKADLVSSSYMGSVVVWQNNGDATFRTTGTLPGYRPDRPVLADVNGDGRLDIVYGNSVRFPPFNVYVYLNAGGGEFNLAKRFDTGPYLGGPIATDFDGDGRASVVYTDQDERQQEGPFLMVQTWTSGGFVARRYSLPLSPQLFFFREWDAKDWNGDGPAEVFVLSGRGGEVLGSTGSRTDVSVVPVLLSTTGLLGSRFDSDLLLTNSGESSAHLTLRYTATVGGGSGTVERDLAPGRQLFAPSAVGFLRDAGLAIATEGNVIGTLRIEATGASAPRAVNASVRTTTPAGAGVAYGGAPFLSLLRGPSIVPWLLETAKDRSNLGLVNAGAAPDGPVTLRVEVHAGDSTSPPVVLPDVVLAPGEFAQIGRVLAAAGLGPPLGWARVSRVAGNAPYLAWAAINDAGSGDGSFVPARPEVPYVYDTWVVPSAVQTSRYATEFVATNPGTQPLAVDVTLVATGTVLTETIPPGATFYLPDLFAELRVRGLAGAPPAGAGSVSPLFVKARTPGTPIYAGIRVTSAPAAGRSYGVFEAATPTGSLTALSGVVPDLRQDAATRTNLGVVNLLTVPLDFRVDVYDGASGALAGSRTLSLASYELVQLNAILRDVAAGTARAWARVTPVRASPATALPFVAYAVINDGPAPGAGTDDGSFVPGIPE